jgi:hypothetical protein
MTPRFFGSLNNSITVLERSFGLLGQRQINAFTDKIIGDLIGGDDTTIKEMSKRPRIIPKNSQMKMNSLVKEIESVNPKLLMK